MEVEALARHLAQLLSIRAIEKGGRAGQVSQTESKHQVRDPKGNHIFEIWCK